VASDAVGSHHGTITGAQWTSGIKGSALHFDGTGNQVQVPNSGFNPNGNAISFSFWFRLDNVGDNGAFIFQNVKYILKMDAQGRIGSRFTRQAINRLPRTIQTGPSIPTGNTVLLPMMAQR
jgi:hypothetical protein